MNQSDLHDALSQLFRELTGGTAPGGDAYMLNPGDPGLLRSLERLSAAAASRTPAPDAASIAAHVDHICYGLELLIRWSDGEANPWASANWAESWTRRTVNDQDWTALRARLDEKTRRWQTALETPRPLSPLELNGVVASVAHLAYHLGAIRQIDRSIRGPEASRAG